MTLGNQVSIDPATPAFTAGIMAHNEGANIARAIQAILNQRVQAASLDELIVVASGCTDRTPAIVTELARVDERIRLIVQERREGKASAVNLFIRAARSPLLLMAGGDVVLKDGAAEALLQPFRDLSVGMVGGRPVPVNDEHTFLGHAGRLLWEVHDQIARQDPKLGEVIAFRNVVPSIPVDTPVDEISIQALITQLGYRLVYEPRAVVYNRCPTTVSDFLRQRRRIYAGHLQVRQQQGYSASTMNAWRVLRALLATPAMVRPSVFWWTVGAVSLEALARGLGTYDHLLRRPHHQWQMVATTKSPIGDDAMGAGRQSVLAFRIVGFHEYVLEHGARAGHALEQHVVVRLREALAVDAIVSAGREGTIVAILGVERAEAESQARHGISAVERDAWSRPGRSEPVAVRLACGVISFSHAGQALALSLTPAA